MIFDKLVDKFINNFVVWEDNYKRFVFKQYVLSVLKELNKEKTGALKCGTRCLIISSILIKRLPDTVTINQNNIKEYFIPAMIISFKLTEDDDYEKLFESILKTNNKKIFELEMKFCNNLNHKLFIKTEEFNKILIDCVKECV